MKYIRSEYQITKNFKDSNLYKYAQNKPMEKIIKNCRGVNMTKYVKKSDYDTKVGNLVGKNT